MKRAQAIAIAAMSATLLALAAATPASAIQLKYKPVSPTFGGNANGQEWQEFYNYSKERAASAKGSGNGGGGSGQSVDLPDFSGLLDALNSLSGGFSNLPTIIIPVY